MIMAFGGWPSMRGAADWDLQAVVRGFFSPPAVAPAPVVDAMAALLEDDDVHAGVGTEQSMDFPDLGTSTSAAMHELEELCKPFFIAALPAPAPAPSLVRPQRVSQIARSKRRKSQVKREVCQVPADGLAADKWAWRKYGQKPIKGSPYPRGYYRCSTSKACPAKKQVERSCSDPSMFVITYAAEHNHSAPTHRNSLAGSTRQKHTTKLVTAAGAQLLAASPSANTYVEEEEREETSHLGKQEEEEEGEEGEEEEAAMMIKEEEEEEVLLSDDMFMELGGGSPGDVLDFWFSDSSPIDFSDHWFAAGKS